MGRIEIRDAKLGDQPLLAQTRQFVEGVEPFRMLECPPVELKKVDALDSKPGQPLFHPRPHHVACHRSGWRAPLREGARSRDATAGQQVAGDDLGAAIMVGHVEGVEPFRGVGGKPVGAGFRVDHLPVLFDIGDLPQPGQDARDLQPV